MLVVQGKKAKVLMPVLVVVVKVQVGLEHEEGPQQEFADSILPEGPYWTGSKGSQEPKR